MSNTYLKWAQDNMSINGFTGDRHRYIREDCLHWMQSAIEDKQTYDLIFIDPPTFSNSKKMTTSLDISRDHLALLSGCLALLDDDGLIIFSTNAKNFKLDESLSDECFLKDMTSYTTTEDFRRKPLHRCWCLAREQGALKALDALKR
jgi:23S rRNA (guanine2445-N2)-methyltransferase / 23S rRNA (guanine2069-N7)-methyltransferase